MNERAQAIGDVGEIEQAESRHPVHHANGQELLLRYVWVGSGWIALANSAHRTFDRPANQLVVMLPRIKSCDGCLS